MMLRVTDYYRWRRAKIVMAALCLIGAIAAIGGLESQSGEGGDFFLAMVCLVLCWALTINLIRNENRRNK